jgi:hypothetical protein
LSAFSTALTVFGFLSANSAVNAQTFSPDVLGVERCEADAVGDDARVPGLADAEAVHLAHLHVGDHLRWWDDDECDVLVGIDAAGPQPIAGPHGVRPGREGHREGHR